MKIISTDDLRRLEVINLCGGEKLGYVTELEIDIENARIVSLIVTSGTSIPFFSKKSEYILPWCKIECIGSDAILVKILPGELSQYTKDAKSNKKK